MLSVSVWACTVIYKYRKIKTKFALFNSADVKKFEDFIIDNENADCARLLMSSAEWPGSPVEGLDARNLCVSTIEVRRRLRNKLPRWYSDAGMVYPNRLCGEQCSSESTAAYKAILASRILEDVASDNRRIADLTGGLGADSYEFSKVCGSLLYNEMNPDLCAATRHNYARLGVSNVVFTSVMVGRDNVRELLEGFAPAMIYLDPARRSESGRKVFMLEDCSPDLLTLKDALLEISGDVLVKLSPMADISMLVDRLGSCAREIHIVGSGGVHGECKELLVWMQRGWTGGTQLVCIDADEPQHAFSFTKDEESKASVRFAASQSELMDAATDAMLFEPSSAMMKAGPYRLLAERFGLTRLGRNVQLYLAPKELDTDELSHLGKLFTIKSVRPFGKSEFKAIAKEWPRCEVSARNLPLTSEELKKKMGVGSGSNIHIFGAGCDFEDRSSARYLFVTETIA